MTEKLTPDHYSKLTSELVLSATESTGYRATGRFQQLNSMENRVYAIEVVDDASPRGVKQVVIKFYRPERWNADQILSEQAMQRVLTEENIPTPKLIPLQADVAAVGKIPWQNRIETEFLKDFSDENTLGLMEGFYYCVWEKVAGRACLELQAPELEHIGSLIARMHNLFESRLRPEGFSRHRLSTEYFGEKPIEYLKAHPHIPRNLRPALFETLEFLVRGLQWINTCCDFIPVHGDLHRANLMQTSEGGEFWVVDFDDCMLAPDIQDLWLLASGCHLPTEEGEDATMLAFELLKQGYENFRKLPTDSEFLIEPLRTLRMIYYMGWIANRWYDPFFRQVFSFFTEHEYWERSLMEMEEQKRVLESLGLLQF